MLTYPRTKTKQEDECQHLRTLHMPERFSLFLSPNKTQSAEISMQIDSPLCFGGYFIFVYFFLSKAHLVIAALELRHGLQEFMQMKKKERKKKHKLCANECTLAEKGFKDYLERGTKCSQHTLGD